MNRVILMGRLTRPPELRQTASGTTYARFTLAVNRRFAKQGEQQADFVSCIAWQKPAEFIGKYFGKGVMIAVVGRIQTGSYEKDGVTHYTTDVVVEEAYFTGERHEAVEVSFDNFEPLDISEEELPF